MVNLLWSIFVWLCICPLIVFTPDLKNADPSGSLFMHSPPTQTPGIWMMNLSNLVSQGRVCVANWFRARWAYEDAANWFSVPVALQRSCKHRQWLVPGERYTYAAALTDVRVVAVVAAIAPLALSIDLRPRSLRCSRLQLRHQIANNSQQITCKDRLDFRFSFRSQ